MSDADTIRAMLTRARIAFHEEDDTTIDRFRSLQGGSNDYALLPDGASAICVSYYTNNTDGKSGMDQPFDGRYSFDHDFIFDADGNLIALWGWE